MCDVHEECHRKEVAEFCRQMVPALEVVPLRSTELIEKMPVTMKQEELF